MESDMDAKVDDMHNDILIIKDWKVSKWTHLVKNADLEESYIWNP